MTTDLQNFLPTKEDEQNFLSIISEREEVSLVMRKRDELKTNSWPWSTPHCWCLAQEWSAFLIGADDECEQICCKLSPMVNLLSRSLLDGNTIHTESKYVLSDLSRPDILYNKLWNIEIRTHLFCLFSSCEEMMTLSGLQELPSNWSVFGLGELSRSYNKYNLYMSTFRGFFLRSL